MIFNIIKQFTWFLRQSSLFSKFKKLRKLIFAEKNTSIVRKILKQNLETVSYASL